jgi:ABC-type xylose transport system substrate-binding protein
MGLGLNLSAQTKHKIGILVADETILYENKSNFKVVTDNEQVGRKIARGLNHYIYSFKRVNRNGYTQETFYFKNDCLDIVKEFFKGM